MRLALHIPEFSSRLPDEWRRTLGEIGVDGLAITAAALSGAGIESWSRNGDVSQPVTIAAVESQIDFASMREADETEQRRQLRDIIALAGQVGAANVLIGGDRAEAAAAPRDRALSRIVAALRAAGPLAVEYNLTLAVRNGGALADSRELWHVVDAVRDLPIRACLDVNAINGPISLWIPRLAGMLALVRTRVDESATDGQDLERLINLLRGIAYRGWLLVDVADGASAADAARRLKTEIAKPVVPLSAYKGDRNAPRFARSPGVAAK
ncbi:MAG: TIM barrel protein [Phycisphaerae bacterium]